MRRQQHAVDSDAADAAAGHRDPSPRLRRTGPIGGQALADDPVTLTVNNAQVTGR
jgi:hypothetical protein